MAASALISGILPTLTSVISNEIVFLGGLRGELQSIKDEFQQMMHFLHGADMLVHDHPDLRVWVDQVRDVAYDVEDVLDEFVMQCSYHRRSTRWYGVFQKMYTNSVSVVSARHQLATRVQEIKKRVRDISETHARYKTQYAEQGESSRFSRVNNMQYDRRRDALLLEEADLVGIEVPKKELTDLLLKADSRSNVISVVGMGGLGKTTLVKKVYNDVSVRSQFDYHVWITVSESFILEDLFRDAIRQLFKDQLQQLPQEWVAMDLDRLKEVVKEFLQNKRYIVVFDDVWHVAHWEAIHLAFPRNQLGSRLLVTTRSNELGQVSSKTEAGGCAYNFRPLPDQEAMKLLCRKAFAGSNSCPKHLNQACEKILRKCEGLPLAIAVIGRVLATRKPSVEEWELFYKRLGAEMKRNSQLDAMSKLISLSYYDLSPHLKNCFLHLSIFPEDFSITVDSLVALWTAERFVEKIDGMTIDEVAEGYVTELVDRCLVQVIETFSDGSIKCIRVHDIIRHITLVKANEQNLTTIVRGQEGMIFQKNVRRLALHGSIIGHSKQNRSYCKSIRSLYVFDCDYTSMEILLDLLSHGQKLVKVLYVSNISFTGIPKEIYKLFHLKYLNLQHIVVKSVSKSIGNLQNLETLNLMNTGVTQLPAEIQTLQHLRHLHMGEFLEVRYIREGVRACCRIGNLKSLQRLYTIDASQVDNIRIVTEIGKLVQLRDLGIAHLKMEDGKELCSSLGNLTELRKLYVQSVNPAEVIDFQYIKSTYLPGLQILVLAGRLEKNPEWISSLHALTDIHLLYNKLNNDPLACLHDLPNLITLTLFYAYEGESLCFKAGGFPKLNNLVLRSLDELRCVIVEDNSLPFLQKLTLVSCQSMKELPTGFENLAHLQKLELFKMSDAFVNNIENLDKEGAAYKRLLQIPQVVLYDETGNHKMESLSLDKRTGKFNKLTSG